MSSTDIPLGHTKLPAHEVYVKEAKIVVLGEPGDNHDCDKMGCGSASSHIIAYCSVEVKDLSTEDIEQVVREALCAAATEVADEIFEELMAGSPSSDNVRGIRYEEKDKVR